MTTTQNLRHEDKFLLRDDLGGRFVSPEPMSWEQAQTEAASGFFTIVRYDEHFAPDGTRI